MLDLVWIGNIFAIVMFALLVYALFFREDDGDDHGA
jgi:hypothetical protein